MLTTKRNEVFGILAACWLSTLFLAAPVVARVGLYDYEGESWHQGLYYLPVVGCAGVLLGWLVFRRLFHQSLLTYRKLLLIHFAFALVLLVGVSWLLGKGQNSTVNFCNANEQDIAFAVSYRPNRLQSRTEGYWHLTRGSCQEITRNFLRTPVNYQFHAATKRELTDWLAGADNTWDVDRSDLLGLVQGADIPQYSPAEASMRKPQGKEIDWENADVQPVTYGEFSYTNGIPNWPEPRHFAPFVNVPTETSHAGDRHTVWLTKGGLTRTLEVCNLQPVKTSVDVYEQTKRKEWRVESRVDIEPGFCKSFDRTFYRVAPAFSIRAEVRGKVIEWYLGEEVVLEGGDDAVSVCIPEGSKNVVFHDEPKPTKCKAEESTKSFARVPNSFGENSSETFNLTLPEELIPLPRKGDEIDLEKAKIKIRHLASWWPRRMEYFEMFGDKEPPFTVGPAFKDTSPNALGVTVAETLDVSPLGTPISLKKNMVVVEAFGQPIYSPLDFEILMVQFGNSKTHGGVLKTFPFKAWNGAVLEAHEGTVFFNPAAWPRVEEERAAARRWGFSNGVSFGLAVQLYCAGKKVRAWWYGLPFDYTDCTWETQQFVARMKQFFWDEYDDANFVGKLASMIPSVMSVTIVARLVGGSVIAEVIAGGGVSALEAAGWAYEEAVPGANIYEEMRAAALPAAKLGAIAKLLLRR